MSVKIFQNYQGFSVKIDGQCYIFVEETTESINADPSEIGGTYDSCLECTLESSSSSLDSSSSSSSSGFFPYDIADIQLWLDAADSNTITESSGSVSQWDDKSGNDNDVTQGTGSLQPTYQTNVQNGNNIIRWDGGDYMDKDPYTWPQDDITMFIVQKRSVTTASYPIFSNPREVNRIGCHLTWSTGDGYFDFGEWSAGGRCQWSWTGGNNWNYFTMRNEDGVGQNVWMNGTSQFSDLTTNDFANPSNYSLRIGETFNGDIGEIIIYNRALTTSERLQVEDYLSDKWGI